MTRAACALVALSSSLLALVGCDGGGGGLPPIDTDAGCGEPGVPLDQPVIGCPAAVELGCLGSEGAVVDYAVAASSCDGSSPTITCTPERGSTVTPGVGGGTCTARGASGAEASCVFPIRYRVRGAPTLVCAAPVSAACTGPRTRVTVLDASAMASCDGGELGAPTSDAPAGGYVVGTTTVTWTASAPAGPLTCTTDVTVTDDVAPVVTCPGATTVLRTSASAPIDVPPPSASDACDDALDFTFEPMPSARGSYTVMARATDDGGNTATCAFPVTILDVFAPEGLRVVSAELASDGTTDVTIGWEPSAGGDVAGYRVERAASEAGPWTMLGAPLASDVTTYTDAEMPGMRAYYRVTALGPAEETGGVTPPVRALAIADDEYDLGGQMVPGIGFATSLYGVVRHPADLAGGPYPLVLFMHGNHGNCRPGDGSEDDCQTRTQHACTRAGFTTTPNAEGYVYLMESLAAQGFVTASVSANALNCRDDYIPERVQLLVEHVRRWAAWATTGTAPPFMDRFRGSIDLARVALVGHSRGGEAVAGAPAAMRATPVPGVTLASVFAIGPTDYHDYAPSGVPYAVLLPGCDADVSTLEGLLAYDRGLDPTDRNERAQVLYVGANHNFFNSEWRFDDNAFRAVCDSGTLVGAPAQRGMLEIVLADWLRGTASADALPAYVRADSGTPALVDRWSGRAIDLRWSYSAADRREVDDFDDPSAPTVNALGGMNSWSDFIASIDCTGTCSRSFPHVTRAARIAWRDTTAIARFGAGAGGLDTSAYTHVSVRFASRLATINMGVVDHEILFRLIDDAGTDVTIPLSSVGRIPNGYPSRQPREILSTVRVPIALLRAMDPTLDTTRIAAIELEVPAPGGNTSGSVWIADLDLASE